MLDSDLAEPYDVSTKVLMQASILNSQRAIEISIYVVRVFVKLREMIASHKDLTKRLDELEMKYDAQFRVVYPVRDYRLCTIHI